MADAFFADTLERWRREGMPADAAPSEYFDFDFEWLFADLSLRLPEKRVEETDEYLIADDKFGFTAKRYKQKAGIQYIANRVKTPADWERLRERLAVDYGVGARVGTTSYFEPFEQYPTWPELRGRFAAMRKREKFVLLNGYGPYEHMWRMCGYADALMMVMSEPGWCEDIVTAHMGLLIGTLRKAIDEGVRVDGMFLVEDLGVQSGPLFRPALVESLLVPHYRRLGEFLRSEGIWFFMHSCGGIGPLIPMLVDAGVQVLHPLQATAGLDVRDLKPQYGDRLAFMGNINAKIMSDPAAIEQEIRDKIPATVEGGGYIYHSDHSVPSDVGLAEYQRILCLVREVSVR